MRFTRAFPILIAGAVMLSGTATAQTWPAKPVRFILNVSVGVLSDVLMRAAAVELARQTGQPWVIENRQGGNFVIGANACKSSPPDGYTVCLVNEQSMSLNPHVISKLPYDPDRDFAPITNLYVQVSGIAVAAGSGVKSVADLQRMGAKSQAMNFATLGPGTAQDVLRQWMNSNWKTEFVGVPYKGMNLILGAIVAGESELTQTSLGSAVPFMTGGKVRILAVTSSRRLARLPDVPTFAEVGLGPYIDLQGRTWWGLVAPAGVPDAVVRRVNSEFQKVFADAKIAQMVENMYLDTLLGTPEEFAAFLRKDRMRAAEVVKRFNIPRN